MDNSLFVTIDNGSAVSMSKVPVLETETFRKTLIEAVNTEKNQLFSFFALPLLMPPFLLSKLWSSFRLLYLVLSLHL